MAWNRNGDTRTKYPQVWCKFKGRRPLSDGRTFNFKIQDVPQDMFPRIIQFMTDNFMRDEPCCKIMGK